MKVEYQNFHEFLFKSTNPLSPNMTMVIGSPSRGQLLWAREFAGYAIPLKQHCLILTQNAQFWKKAIPLATEKKGQVLLDFTKTAKDSELVHILETQNLSEENLLDEIKKFHDDNLTSDKDESTFKVLYDSDFLLSPRVLHNIKNFARKSNIYFFFTVDELNKKNETIFLNYLDVAIKLSDCEANHPDTLGQAQVLKANNYHSFLRISEVLMPKFIMFWSVLKHNHLFFREIDFTEVI